MSVTVKVNGTANSLVHKGSNGVSMATVPDVCKTPSPGGPVPLPYPNVSQSATLAKGTTTVKADGKMIAIKGSEFSMSNGDNAGTLGGVKSSTFMKESTWISYSFDVKMEGKNACRLTDKKFQNHENTVDLGGEIQHPITGELVFDLTAIDCEEKKADKREGKAWDDCMVEELCDMVNSFNALDKSTIKRLSPSPSSPSSPDFATYNQTKETFATNFANLVAAPATPENEIKIRNAFGSACRYEKWKNGDPPRNPRPPRDVSKHGNTAMHPDHVHDAGLNGPIDDAGAMKWVNGRVNTLVGNQMRNYDADKKLRVTCLKCCK